MANLEFAEVQGYLPFEYPDPVEAYGFLLPKTFRTYFLVEDGRFDRRWSVELLVQFGEAGTAVAQEVITRGFTNDRKFGKNYTLSNLEAVERWQIDATKNALSDLLTVSTLYAIEYYRYTGTIDDHALTVKVRKESLDSGNWELGSRGFEDTDSKTLRKLIEKYQDRRGISQEDHLLTARLVADEIERAKNEKTRSRHNLVVADFFGLTQDGGEYRVRKAREAGFLTENNKVSAKKAGSKTKGKTNGKKK